MQYLRGLAVALAVFAVAGAARADHVRPGLFSDVGAPPAEEDVSHGTMTTPLLIDRCKAMLDSSRTDGEGHLTDYKHDYKAGFCLGWINASMVFLNVRDAAGAPALGVCLPDGIHTFEVIQTFLDFSKENPDDLKYNPSFLIYWAMLEKYPCQK